MRDLTDLVQRFIECRELARARDFELTDDQRDALGDILVALAHVLASCSPTVTDREKDAALKIAGDRIDGYRASLLNS